VSGEWVTRQVIYTGRRLDRKGVLRETFIYADDQEYDIWLGGKPKFAAIGRTYEVEILDGKSFRMMSATWVKGVPVHDLQDFWAGEDRAAYLAQCRGMLRHAAPAQRSGLLAAILREIGA
jgi:hypothetical protein